MIWILVNVNGFPLPFEEKMIWGGPKKSVSWTVHLFYCWCLLLFYSGIKHKQWLKVWFLTYQMLVLPGRINFDPFSKTWKFFSPKIPMKYSKNGQNFVTPKNTLNVLIVTYWRPCKTAPLSHWSRSKFTFFWSTLYQ